MPGMETDPHATGSSEAVTREHPEELITTNPQAQKHRGLGRVIIVIYAIFAISACARAGYQIITKFEVAPLSYGLSGMSAVIYLIATIALATPGYTAWQVALWAVWLEIIGVIGVGAWSVLQPQMFQESSIWSYFGNDYAFVPLVLPFVGLWWLLRNKPPRTGEVPINSGEDTE